MTREEARTALGDRNNLLWGMSKEEQKYYSEALDMAISALSEPERKKGEWIGDKDYPICSKCGINFMDYVHYTEDAVCLKKPGFCPNCGADMRPEPYKKGE